MVEDQAALRKQAQADAAVRNQIEGKFGQGKRRFSLARVMAKLSTTAETSIAITFLVMNLERRLRSFILLVWLRLSGDWRTICRQLQRRQALIFFIPDLRLFSAQNRNQHLKFGLIFGG